MLRKATIALCLIATCIAVSCSDDEPIEVTDPDAGMDAPPMPAMCEPRLDVIYDEAEQTWTTEYQPMKVADWGVMCATTEKDVYVTLSMRRYPVLDPTADLEYITTNTARSRVCVLPVHANYSMDPRYVYQFVAWTVDNKSKVMHLQIDVPEESVCSELQPDDVTGCHDGEHSTEAVAAACAQAGASVSHGRNDADEIVTCSWMSPCSTTQTWRGAGCLRQIAATECQCVERSPAMLGPAPCAVSGDYAYCLGDALNGGTEGVLGVVQNTLASMCVETSGAFHAVMTVDGAEAMAMDGTDAACSDPVDLAAGAIVRFSVVTENSSATVEIRTTDDAALMPMTLCSAEVRL